MTIGTVIFLEPAHPIPGVYAIENEVEYTYCDRCGSFSIATRDLPRTSVERLASIVWPWMLLCAVGWLIIAPFFAQSWSGAFLLGIFGLLASFAGIPRRYLKCRKCGNEQISNANPHNYRSDDRSVIDVSDDLVLKRLRGARIT